MTYREISREEVEGRKGSVIGKAIEDLKVYILDEQMRK